MKNATIATVMVIATFFGIYSSQRHTHEEVHHIAGNFSADLVGIPDTRQDTWGTTAVTEWTLTFVAPPPGYQIRIHKVVGDVVARWIRFGGPTDIGYTGYLGGIFTGPNNGSAYADWAADGHFIYVQGDIGANGVSRITFDSVFDATDKGAILQDNKLTFRVASYLDETPYDTHMEITYSQIEFCYEKIQ